MKHEKTIEQRLKTYAISQDDSLDRHMPKTSKKKFAIVCLCAPILCLGAWLWLIIVAMKES